MKPSRSADEVLARLDEPGDFADTAPDQLRGLLEGLREVGAAVQRSPERLKAAAAGSYHHPNGFEKLLLWTSRTGRKFLLHTWTENSLKQAVAAEHGHNHRWPFATLVVRGAYRFETYDVFTSDDAEAYQYRYRSAASGACYELHESGRANIEVSLAFDLRTGCTCVSNSSIVHRVVALETPLVTLFVQGPADREETTVVSREPAGRTGQIEIDRFDEEVWRSRFEARLAEIGR